MLSALTFWVMSSSIDPISPFFEQGIAITAALTSTSLFIWSQVHARGVESDLDQMKSDVDRLTDRQNETLESLASTAAQLTSLREEHREMTSNVASIIQGIGRVSGDLSTMAANTNMLASNQSVLVGSLQRVIEQLISALQE